MPNNDEWALAREPKYLLQSVDNALELLQMLRDRGGIRVATAADALGVSRSTIHRLLSMLVYRGFAIQDEDRAYIPGPGMNVAPVKSERADQIIAMANPIFEEFVSQIEETVSLVARYGTTLRFIRTYVHEDVAAISSRQGYILPAHQTSGGKILLSALTEDTLKYLYRSEPAKRSGTYLSPIEFASILRELSIARDLGYATNMGKTEREVYAIAMSIDTPGSLPWLAFAVAIPYRRRDLIRDQKFLRKCYRFQHLVTTVINERKTD